MALFSGWIPGGPAAKALAATLTTYRGWGGPQWDRHIAAVYAPRAGFEASILGMAIALAEYTDAHAAQYGGPVGGDCVMGVQVGEIAACLIALLNGETGRFDCGTLDRAIRELFTLAGCEGEP